MHNHTPDLECRIDTSRVREVRPGWRPHSARPIGTADLVRTLGRMRVRLSPRRRATAAAPLLIALLSWFAIPGEAADFHLDSAGDRYGTISHGIGGAGSYPIRIPGYGNENAGTLLMHEQGGGDVEAYCIDLRGVRNPAAVFTSGERRIDPIAYVLAHHFPVVAGAGALADVNQEAAAVQLAVWTFSDAVNLDRVTAPTVPGFGTVLDRARTIAGEASAGWSAWAVQQAVPPAIALPAPAPAVAPGSATLTAIASGGPAGSIPDGTPIVFTVTSVEGTIDGARTVTRMVSGGQASVAVSDATPGTVTVAAQITVNGLSYLQLTPSVRPNQTLIVTAPAPVSGLAGQNLTFSGRPKLTVTKTVSDGGAAGAAVEARPGDRVTYTIGYANGGNAVAPGVTAVDDLGRGELARLRPGDIVIDGGTSRSFDAGSRLATWTIGDVAPGASGTLTVAATIPASLPDSGNGVSLCNAATLASPEAGTVTSAPACAHVTTAPHLATVKVVDAATAVPGQTLHYSVTVTNDGSRDLSGVAITDSLAGGTLASLVNVRASAGGSFDPVARLLTWTVPPLGSGQSATVMFDAGVPTDIPTGADTCFVNTATAGGGNSGGPYPSGRATTCVHPRVPGLPVTGSGPPPLATARSLLTAPAATTSHGPSRVAARAAIVLVCLLVSTLTVITGLRREGLFR